jgi:hypothetical protein
MLEGIQSSGGLEIKNLKNQELIGKILIKIL